MEKLPSFAGPGATPDAFAPVVPGANPNQLTQPAAPTIGLSPSAVSEAPLAARPTVYFEATTLPPVEAAPADATVGKSEMVAPVDAGAAAMPAPEAMPPQTGRAEKVRNAARNVGRFASVAMEAAGALDRTGIPDALIDSGIGGRTGTVLRGAAKATKTAAQLNDARHKVEAALQPSPTGEGGNNEGPVASTYASQPKNRGAAGGRASGLPQPDRSRGTVYGRGASAPTPPRYPGDPEDQRVRAERRDNPQAYGPLASSWERGADPRHLPLDPYLGLSAKEYAAVMADTERGPDGRTGPERLAAIAARMQRAGHERIRADRPIRGHRDPITGEEIPYYGPAQGPLVTGGKIRPAVDRSRRAIYGEPGAGWNPDPRDPREQPPATYEPVDRSLDNRSRSSKGTTIPERARGVLRRGVKRVTGALGRVFTLGRRQSDAQQEANFNRNGKRAFDQMDAAASARAKAAAGQQLSRSERQALGLSREEVFFAHRTVDKRTRRRGLPKGYAATERDPGGSSQPMVYSGPESGQHRRGGDGRREDPTARTTSIKYSKLRFRN